MFILILNIFMLSLFQLATGDGFESTLGDVKPDVSDEDQAAAALGVIQRLVPGRASEFRVSVDSSLGPRGKDTFVVQKGRSDSVVNIVGSSGIAAAWGFHHYLKYSCSCHVSWEADQLDLPPVLPPVNITVTSLDRLRYYQNVCTSSYSFVWWDWARWERELDWMALNGINLALAAGGQEAVWERVYRRLGLSPAEVAAHFAGPAFLAWLYPDVNMTELSVWNNFPDEYCCPYLIEPTDPLFQHIGNLFLTEVTAEFGTNHAYYCDTFNEMSPSSGDVRYLASVGRAIYQAMRSVDAKAVWVKQNWEFVDRPLFWTQDRVEAFLTSVPLGRMIVLDLQSEQHERYTVFNSYYGQPFIWCMLHNFGGTLGLFGSLHIVNNKVFEGRNFIANSTMVGTGLTPEGINQNYVVYDLMNEMVWRTRPTNLSEWITTYAARRYGQDNPHAAIAWELLKSSVYNFTGVGKMRGKYIINVRPSLRLQPYAWYSVPDVGEAWTEMLRASTSLGAAAAFRHDLVDVTRQALELLASAHYVAAVAAFRAGNLSSLQTNGRAMLDILSGMDEILASNEAFLLGRWLQAAKAKGTTDEEKQLYEYNARNQITLWGPNGQIRDYANKQWAGVISHYFRPRWQMFFKELNESLVNGTEFNQTVLDSQILQQIEKPFTSDRSAFPINQKGDSVEISRRMHRRWHPEFRSFSESGLFGCWTQLQYEPGFQEPSFQVVQL
ncbi:alpha-N-acetylglucosaminidase isoform X2 [Bacillus rossius redtenbacheri]|uniref:alpha-N-acetylglucosaminidase isoform X2 n=1 Tax=Bacillus rossius redtenbacheri TaxID=93214 RepID=UPI002FDE61B6